MQFLYPGDLIERVRMEWVAAQGAGSETSPRTVEGLPKDLALRQLLDVAYHVSLLREETRTISLRLMYAPRAMLANPLPNDPQPAPYELQSPIPMTVSNLLKLAPAVRVTQAAICVEPAPGSDTELVIWGIADLGLEWWRLLSAESSAALVPPNLLTVTALGPGTLSISTSGDALARIQGGRFLTTALPALQDGYVGSFFEDAVDDLASAVGVPKGAAGERVNKAARFYFFNIVQRLLQLVREQEHGATLLFLPTDFTASDTRLNDRLLVKYRMNVTSLWPRLVELRKADDRYWDLWPGLHDYEDPRSPAPPKERLQLLETHQLAVRLQSKVEEHLRFLAQLSAVDGAVVLNKHLDLIGFGSEISATSASLQHIREAANPDATQSTQVELSTFGTRHRSAMRMCSSLEDCLAIVVSQDGPVRAIKRVGSNVYSWPNVGVGRSVL